MNPNEPSLSIEENLSEADERFVVQSLIGYNLMRVGEPGHRNLSVLSRIDGQIVGGLLGMTYWNWLFIKILWVAETHRGRGLGRSLMEAAEREAFKRGCRHAHCDTFDFQALPFYQKLGYEIFGRLEDCPAGHSRYYLQKRNLCATKEV